MSTFLTEIFMLLFCEKNSDGSKNLILKGNDLWARKQRRITDDDIMALCDFLNNNEEIVKLELCYNQITSKGLKKFIKHYLKTENNLEYLCLMGNNIDYRGMQDLCQLGERLGVKTLRLNGNKIGSSGGKYLSLLLGSNTSITHLDIAETDQTLSSMAYLLTILREDHGFNRTLTVLDISRVIPSFDRYQYSSDHLADSIGQMLRFNSTLIEFHAQKCQFSGHDIESMLHGLKYNKTLLFLDIGYNRIADHGLELLSEYLKGRPPLLGLNIAGNGIGNHGACHLHHGMPFSRLRLLDISNNKMTDGGITDILNTIKKPVMLRHLYIWGNKITHKTNCIIQRMLLSGVLNQEYFDVRLYKTDGKLHAARYNCDRYKHKYYCEMDYACPVDVKIKRNKVEEPDPSRKFKVDFKYYPKYPPQLT